MRSVAIAAVIASCGRAPELARLLSSLRDQTRPADEILILDQSGDMRLAPVLARYRDLPIRHIQAPWLRGVCAKRNLGWRCSSAEYLIFPDDDCWYPPGFFGQSLELARSRQVDIVCGRPVDARGRSINGRFRRYPCRIDRRTVWFSQIEWACLIRRDVLVAIRGFSEDLGPGGGTPWGAHEIQDLTLRAIHAGFRADYEPSLVARHPLSTPVTQGARQVARYAQGMGCVLARHHYPLATALIFALRPLAGAMFSVLGGNLRLARLRLIAAAGRYQGYRIARRALPEAQ